MTFCPTFLISFSLIFFIDAKMIKYVIRYLIKLTYPGVICEDSSLRRDTDNYILLFSFSFQYSNVYLSKLRIQRINYNLFWVIIVWIKNLLTIQFNVIHLIKIQSNSFIKKNYEWVFILFIKLSFYKKYVYIKK